MHGKTLVSLLGGQPSPTLIMAAKLRDELGRVVVLSTKDMERRGTVAHLAAALKILSPALLVESYIIEDPFDLIGVREFVESLPALRSPEQVVDITGATKLMSIALHGYAVAHRHPVYYVDSQYRLIRGIGDAPELPGGPGLPFISIPVLLMAYGREIVEKHDEEPLARHQQLGDLILKKEVPWDRWWPVILDVTKGHRTDAGPHLEANVKLDHSLTEMLGLLRQLGFVRDTSYAKGKLSLTFSSAEDKAYLTSGHWLEDYAFRQARTAGFDQVYRQVKVKLDESSQASWDNELDVVVSHQSRLALIDCKAGRLTGVSKEHLAEILTLAQMSGGIFSTRVVVFKESIGDTVLARRAKAFGINVVSGPELLNLSERLRTLVGGGLPEQQVGGV